MLKSELIYTWNSCFTIFVFIDIKIIKFQHAGRPYSNGNTWNLNKCYNKTYFFVLQALKVWFYCLFVAETILNASINQARRICENFTLARHLSPGNPSVTNTRAVFSMHIVSKSSHLPETFSLSSTPNRHFKTRTCTGFFAFLILAKHSELLNS